MPNDSNFTPIKHWEQTPTGYHIVPFDKLDIKKKQTDDGSAGNIVRCTCPDCSENRRHGSQGHLPSEFQPAELPSRHGADHPPDGRIQHLQHPARQ